MATIGSVTRASPCKAIPICIKTLSINSLGIKYLEPGVLRLFASDSTALGLLDSPNFLTARSLVSKFSDRSCRNVHQSIILFLSAHSLSCRCKPTGQDFRRSAKPGYPVLAKIISQHITRMTPLHGSAKPVNLRGLFNRFRPLRVRPSPITTFSPNRRTLQMDHAQIAPVMLFPTHPGCRKEFAFIPAIAHPVSQRIQRPAMAKQHLLRMSGCRATLFQRDL